MTAKAKKKKKQPSQKQIDRQLDVALDDLDKKVDELFNYAEPIYKAQETNTKLAIDRLISAMNKMAGNPTASIPIEGFPTPFVVRIEKTVRDKAFLYIAVRLLVYAARLDVRIGKFKLLPKLCAECGRKVK